MKKHTKVEEFYINVINCNKRCPTPIWIEREKGIIPRGFYFGNPSPKILVVGKNPGHPLACEDFRGLKGRKLYEKYKNFQDNCLRNLMLSNNASTNFLRNLHRYLIKILIDQDLDLDKLDGKEKKNAIDEIYKRVGRTNLVKCSTEKERQQLTNKWADTCYREFFLDEIKLLSPKIIVPLGREVSEYLKEHKDDLTNIALTDELKHPSRPYRKDSEEERDAIGKIKNTIEEFL
jgi:uracil-DNA glycosylase